MMNIYRLQNISDDPRFEGFAFADKGSLLGLRNAYSDFQKFDPERRDWQAPRLSGLWKPRKVIGNVQPDNDYPMVGSAAAFSQRAVDALRHLLEPNGELLPLVTPKRLGPYYAFNITRVVDVLDTQRSQIRLLGSGFTALEIDHHKFNGEALGDLSIFKIPEISYAIYVTETFAARAREYGLRGMHLMKVSPLPPGTDWYKQAMAELKLQLKSSSKSAPKIAPPRSQVAKPQPKITARPLTNGEERDSLNEALRSYQKKLGLDAAKLDAAKIQERIGADLEKLRTAKLTTDERADRAFFLAIAWGKTLAKKLNWEWVMLEDEAGHKTLAIASPNRSHAVTVYSIQKQGTDGAAELTSHLLYNLILAKEIPAAKPAELRLMS